MSEARPEPDSLTVWLRRMNEGDPKAAEYVANTVYRELRRLAQIVMSHENRHHSLQPTILVNEAFVRLLHGQQVSWQDRNHFYKLAAKKMRQIVIDYFRNRDAAKRPPGAAKVDLESIIPGILDKRDEALIVDEALTELAKFDSRAAQVVELRYFGGYTLEEIAGIVGFDVRTVKRDWDDARAWLRGFLKRKGEL